MSFAKLSTVCLVAWSYHQGMTPPNPAPPKEELTKQTSLNFDVSWYVQKYVPMTVKIHWIICAFDILVITVHHHLDSPSIMSLAQHYGRLLFEEGRVPKLGLTITTMLGALMVFVGSAIRLPTYQSLGTFFRFEASIQKDHQLITTGLYEVVRHPGYTGLVFLQLGWCIWQLGSGSLVRESALWHSNIGKLGVLCYCAYGPILSLYLVLSRMKLEDAALRARFGDSWDRWATKVPYSVIPGVC